MVPLIHFPSPQSAPACTESGASLNSELGQPRSLPSSREDRLDSSEQTSRSLPPLDTPGPAGDIEAQHLRSFLPPTYWTTKSMPKLIKVGVTGNFRQRMML